MEVQMTDDRKPFDGRALGLMACHGTPPDILTGPRIGITRATGRLWRFGLAGVRDLSRGFPR
ncbi:MAG: hypothetical protein ACK4GC_13140 [Paracoccaceae bacterium]